MSTAVIRDCPQIIQGGSEKGEVYVFLILAQGRVV